jgi:hypothetical protein
LNDEELRAVGKAATATESPYGSLVRFLLLTGTRRDEAREMPHSEVVDGVWTIPASRYKTGNEVVLPLSKAAQAVLEELPVLGQFVFSADGRKSLLAACQSVRPSSTSCQASPIGSSTIFAALPDP